MDRNFACAFKRYGKNKPFRRKCFRRRTRLQPAALRRLSAVTFFVMITLCRVCMPPATSADDHRCGESLSAGTTPQQSGWNPAQALPLRPNALIRRAFGVVSIAVFLHCAPPAEAKLGETVSQLTKRFGHPYKAAPLENGQTEHRYHENGFDLAVVVAKGVSVRETYYSFRPLQSDGNPPESIVRGILQTNVPGAKWKKVDPEGRREETAYVTEDDKYRAAIYLYLDNADSTFTVAVYKREYSLFPIREQSNTDAAPSASEAKSTPDEQENTSQNPISNLPHLGEATQQFEKRIGAADKAWKTALGDSEQRHYSWRGCSVYVVMWRGNTAVVNITKPVGSTFSPSETQGILQANVGTSSWSKAKSTSDRQVWIRDDQVAYCWHLFGQRVLSIAYIEYMNALSARDEAAVVAPKAGSLSRSEWRERLKKYCTIPSGHQLLTTQKRLFGVMGRPDDTQHDGRETYWFYKCTDGAVKLAFQLDPEMMGGQIIAEVSDEASSDGDGASSGLASPEEPQSAARAKSDDSSSTSQTNPPVEPPQQTEADSNKERLLIGSWKIGGSESVIGTYTKAHKYYITTPGVTTQTGDWKIEGDNLIQIPRSGTPDRRNIGRRMMCAIIELNDTVLIIGSSNGGRRDGMTSIRVR